MSCGVGHRHSLDLEFLWLWCRPAATAPIRLLAWEPPYTMGTALKRQKKKKCVPILIDKPCLCYSVNMYQMLIHVSLSDKQWTQDSFVSLCSSCLLLWPSCYQSTWERCSSYLQGICAVVSMLAILCGRESPKMFKLVIIISHPFGRGVGLPVSLRFLTRELQGFSFPC